MNEFTGKTEQEAIQQASKALGLNSAQFDIEILENDNSLFRKNNVRIRVYPHSEEILLEESSESTGESNELLEPELTEITVWEANIRDFMQELLHRMGQDGDVVLCSRKDNRLLFNIQDSSDPSQLIGKHGKSLDALQIILNAYLGRLHDEENDVPADLDVDLDVGSYRKRREVKLVKLAKATAAQVENHRNSHLLEIMNPSERRIIHKTLNNWPNIFTVSEGKGTYKQVRIIYQSNLP